MNAELKTKLNEIISHENKLAMHELSMMSTDHLYGLQGFKRMHRYRSRDRFEHAVRLSNFMVEFTQEKPEVSLTFTTPAEMSSLLTSMEQAYSLGRFQIDRLKAAAIMAIDHGEHHLMSELECMLKDQEWESMRYERIIKELRNTKEDPVYIQQKSECLHEKYKSKESEWKVYS